MAFQNAFGGIKLGQSCFAIGDLRMINYVGQYISWLDEKLKSWNEREFILEGEKDEIDFYFTQYESDYVWPNTKWLYLISKTIRLCLSFPEIER